MGYVIKSGITAEQARKAEESRQTDNKFNDLNKKLQTETEERTQTDAEFQAALNSTNATLDDEIAIRSSETSILRADLLTETNQREAAVDALTKKLDDEISTRQDEESELRDVLSSSIDRAKQENTNAINDAINAVKAAIGDDKAAQEIKDENLKKQIEEAAAAQTSNFNSLNNKIEDEIKSRVAEDSKLTGALADEVKARKDEDKSIKDELTAALNQEISDRQGADNNLKSALESKIAAETQTRTSSVNNLETSLKRYTDNKVSAVENSLSDFTAPTNSADGKRGLVPAPPKGMLSGILTAQGWRSPQEASLTISATPAQVGSLTFNGGTQYPTWINFDSAKLQIGGTTSASGAGSYVATFTPKDLYMWSDTLNQETRQVSWKIDALTLAKPTAGVTSFTFNNSAQGINVSNFDSTYINQTGTTSSTNAGDFSAVYSLKNTTNTKWSDNSTGNVTISWSIAPLKLTKPSASNKSFDYDGNSHAPTVSNYNSTYMNRTGTTSASEVGNYSISFSLKNTNNTKWSDNSTGTVTISWAINQSELTEEQSSGFAQSGSLTYNGNVQTPTITNYNSKYHTLTSETSATNAGTYTLYVAPKGSMTWADGSTTPKKVTWKIDKLKIDKPAAASTVFPYNGNTYKLEISNYNSAYMTKTGDESASAVGSYKLTFSLNSDNIVWSDNKTADVVINWTIGTLTLPKPTASTTAFGYTGELKELPVQNYDASYMTLEGTIAETDAGSYSAKFILKDKTNMKWSGNSTADVTISWKINKKKLTAAQSTLSIDTSTTYTYGLSTGRVHATGVYDGFALMQGVDLSIHDISEDSVLNAYDAGTYTIKITPKNNYTWSNGGTTAKTFTWKVNKYLVPKPTVAMLTFDYDRTAHSIKKAVSEGASIYVVTRLIANLPTSTLAISASGTFTSNGGKTINLDLDSSVTDAGSGSMTFSLNPDLLKNIAWEGNTTADVTVALKVNRYKLSKNQSTFTRTYEYFDGVYAAMTIDVEDMFVDGNESPLSERNVARYDDGKDVFKTWEYIYSFTGDTSCRDVGTYTLYIEPTANYAWSDGSTSKKSLTWKVTPAKYDLPELAEGAPSFTYDGQDKSIFADNWSNNFSNWHAKAIGTYAAVRTLANYPNELWNTSGLPNFVTVNEGTCTINWSIGAQIVKTASLSASKFTFDGNVKNVTVTDVDTSLVKVTGDTSGVNAGSYEVTLSLKNKTTTCWDDFTTDDKVLTWNITRKPLTATQSTFSQSGTLSYNGSIQTVTIKNYDANYHKLGGVYTSINAGTFVAQISPLDNYCWNDGTTATKFVTWTINPIKLTKPTASVTNFTYDKEAHALNISSFNTDYITQSGTTAATAAGNYSVTFKLNDEVNTVWADNSTSSVVIAWSITKKLLPHPYISSASEFTYDGNIKTVTIKNYDSKYMTMEGVTSSAGVGRQGIYFTLIDDTVDWESYDSTRRTINIFWDINPAPLSVAESAPSQKSVPTFTGGTISLVNYLQNYSSSKHFLSNMTNTLSNGAIEAVDAGTYTAYVCPKGGYTWDDGTHGWKEISWQIAPAVLTPPTVSADLTYNGNVQSPTITGFDAAKMTLGGTTSSTNAGVFTLTVTLADNYIWESGDAGAVELTWSIAKKAVTVPRFSIKSMSKFDAKTKKPRFDNYDETLMTIGGTTSAVSAGGYYTTFKLKDYTNYHWDKVAGQTASAYWQIGKRTVNFFPKSNANLSYTGNEQAAPFDSSNEFDENFVAYSGDTSATEIGNYSVAATLKYPNDTCFRVRLDYAQALGLPYEVQATTKFATLSVASLTLNWSIGLSEVTAPTLAATYLPYTGNLQTVSIKNFDSSKMTKSGDESKTARGFYKITFSLKDKTNTCWSTGGSDDIVIEWAIGKIRVPKPAIDGDTTFTYDGSSKTLSVTGYDSNTMTQSGYLSATDAGSYNLVYSLKNTTEYVWEDGTTADITFSWKIDKAALPEVTFSQTGTLTYDGTVKTVTIKNYDANKHDLSGVYMSSMAGTFTAKITPKANYTWANGTTTARSVKWTVQPKLLTKPTVAPLNFSYDGNSHSLTISNNNVNLITQSGTSSATEAGSYSVVFSLKNKTNTKWQDGSDSDITYNWTIGSNYVAVPTVSPSSQTSQGLTKNHTFTLSGYDTDKMTATAPTGATLSGAKVTTQGAAKTYSITFALKDKTNTAWAGGSNANQSVSFTITRKALSADESTFTQTVSIPYDGKEHSVTEAVTAIKSEYVGEFYTLSSETGTFGSIKTTITPTSAACWNDGSTAAKTVTWQIESAVPNLTLAKSELTCTLGTDIYTEDSEASKTPVTFTTNSEGDLYITTSDRHVAGANNYVEYANVKASAGKFYVYPRANGTCTFTITQKAAGGFKEVTKYLTVTVSAQAVYLSWLEIQQMAKAGTLLNYMRIGDKTVKIKPPPTGTVGLLNQSFTLQFMLIGYNHNTGVEGNNRAHFMLTAPLTDSNYGKAAGEGFAFSNLDQNAARTGYVSSLLRTRCSEFLNLLPEALQAQIVACKKHYHGNPSSSVTDKIWIPSAKEFTGAISNVTLNEVEQYEYFANGNSRAFGKNYWTRDRGAAGAAFPNIYINTSGTGSPTLCQNYSYGFLPCFTIG